MKRITDPRFSRCSNGPVRNCAATAKQNVTSGMASRERGSDPNCHGDQPAQTRHTLQTRKANRPQSRVSTSNRQVLFIQYGIAQGAGAAARMAQKQRLPDEQEYPDHRRQPQSCMTRIGTCNAPVMISAKARKTERCETCPGKQRPARNSSQALYQQQRCEGGGHDHSRQYAAAAQAAIACDEQGAQQQTLTQADHQARRHHRQRVSSDRAAGLLAHLPRMGDDLIKTPRNDAARAIQQRAECGAGNRWRA